MNFDHIGGHLELPATVQPVSILECDIFSDTAKATVKEARVTGWYVRVIEAQECPFPLGDNYRGYRIKDNLWLIAHKIIEEVAK
jgi:hypothetical protein